MIYLDHAAATYVEEEILAKYQELSAQYFANSNSLHHLGHHLYKEQERSRAQLLEFFGLTEHKLIYTSGASESNSLAIIGHLLQGRQLKHPGEILYLAGDHLSTIAPIQYLVEHFGFTAHMVALQPDGMLDFADLERKISEKTVLFTFSLVNSEIGFCQDLEKIHHFFQKYPQVKIHCDMTAGVLLPGINYRLVDSFTFSLHKLHGLKGSGVLVAHDQYRLRPLIFGGPQEYGLRGGTSNVVMNLLVWDTVQLYQKQDHQHVQHLNQYLRQCLQEIPEIVINTNDYAYTPYILAFSCFFLNSQVIINALSAEAIYVSGTNTCSNRLRSKASTIDYLTTDRRRRQGIIRVSLSPRNTVAEIDRLITVLQSLIRR